MLELRPYQQRGENAIFAAWQNYQHVLYQLATGGGKTFTFSHITRNFSNRNKRVLLKVHRKELVGQISLSLARMGVMHTFVAAKETIKYATMLHVEHLGRSYYSMSANVCVSSVDTLVNRDTTVWEAGIDLQIDDECHHVLRDNKWGKCHAKFENAYSLGVTATPERADGFGLGAHADGVYQFMVLGPTMRELIDMGNLCDYRIFAPPSDINMSKLKTGASGEYTPQSLEDALSGSHVIGDAVDHYLRLVPNTRTISFAPTVNKCIELAAAFNAKGVPAIALSAKSSNLEREEALRKFSEGKILQLVNADLFSEGFDCPAVENVQDLSPTRSLAKFQQRFGRMLRPSPGKKYGIYIDHVHNIRVNDVGTHALPDSPMLWSLDRRKKRSIEEQNNILSLTNCLTCFEVYRAELLSCPHCGAVKPVGMGRPAAAPVQIDDDLVELTPQTLAQLRGEIAQARKDSTEAMMDKFGTHAQGVIPMKWRKDHRQRKVALGTLDESISLWAGLMKSYGFDDEAIHSAFHKAYGMNILYARTLKKADAEKLTEKINCVLVDNGVLLTGQN